MTHRSRLSLFRASILVALLTFAVALPASATIHEQVASFCSGGHGNVFPLGQSVPTKQGFLRALQASGTVTVMVNTPTAGAITIDYNNESPAGKFLGDDVFVEAVPGVWVEVLEPDHPAFENCPKFAFGG